MRKSDFLFRSHFAFAAIVGLLSAWSSISAIPASAAGAEITYWFWKDNPDDNTIANLTAKFEKETGIHVNLMSDVTYNEFFSFLVNSIAAGTAPCAAQLNTTYLGPLINADFLEPLNDRIAAWPGRSAYRYLFSNPRFIAYTLNSAVVAMGTVIVTTTLALLAGTALSRYKFRGRTFVLLGTLLLQLFPTILLITPLYIEMRTFGLLDTKHGLMIVYTAFSLSFSTWLMKGYAVKQPPGLARVFEHEQPISQQALAGVPRSSRQHTGRRNNGLEVRNPA